MPAPDFVAVDGEADEHERYVMLVASDGRNSDQLVDPLGLDTRRCFEFLLSLAKPRRKIVCFGLGYDVNQWLASVGKPTLKELWSTGSCAWRNYLIRWLPRRWLSITDGTRTVRITEVIGFFQQAFVPALTDWGITPASEIVAGKQARGAFTAGELDTTVDYCRRECESLVELMRRLWAATVEADCEPHQWIGAGALAGSMLKARGVADHHAHDSEISPTGAAQDAIMRAYFGGRIEALRLGTHTHVASLDVRSAYPYAATRLPTLSGALLQYRDAYRPAAEHGIWRVRWAGLSGPVMPFPVRSKRSIYYPRSGEGFYHACEVRAALQAGFELTVLDGWELVTNPSPQGAPFAWVPDAYRTRARWQRENRAAQRALKLGLNSLYGKLAQGIGHRGGPPAWQSYMWAGEITARTRATLLTAAVKARDPISIATDGIYAAELTGRPSRKLGGWDADRHDLLFVAQPGLYAAETDGQLTVRSRGHFAREIDYPALRAGYDADGIEHVHHYVTRRFVGLGTALMRRDMRLWRRWPQEDRSISLYPTRKLPGPDGTLEPPPCAPHLDGEASEPYVPKGAGINDTELVDNVQAFEQPCRDEL